ncbi:sulfur reduction protein DsrS [uncultured Thiohalocapsa sp.]|uniref:sulfur reduction protein DsrS n=1 Tax=uncultured Thiohalocapsa sp. TaxID=768990 RepID=UPI0025D2A550|nr:sulfur reduction protein DsrS [uncultured Thiohalocapsa sp.]
MELASEDNFRLNVLLANKPKAIRIDESKLIVYGLSDKGEAKVELKPTGRPEQYLRAVKELISGHILGSPGGYPVYLKRWTRMGQMRDESLEQLLMLGEPEAVVAAVGSPGLTEELARRAWWAMEDADNARRMLENPNIVASAMGPVLAEYVLDYLPFETESDKQTDSVRLILKPGLLDAAKIDDLWSKSGRRQAYLVGFLQALPDALPQPLAPREDHQTRTAQLEPLHAAGNPAAGLLLRAVSGPGQTYLKTVATVLDKPPNQDVVTAAFDCLRAYFAALRPDGDPKQPWPDLEAEARSFADADGAPEAVAEVLARCPEARDDIMAMRILSGVGYGVIRPVLSDPTTLGSLMRRKLKPVMDPIQAQIAQLRASKA